MKKINHISQTIFSKQSKYKLIISLCLLALMLATATSFAGGGGAANCC